MSSRNPDKAVDQSTDWSGWVYDETRREHYQWRRDQNGTLLYQWEDELPNVVVSGSTPRTTHSTGTESSYAGSTTSSDYGEYAHQPSAYPVTSSVNSMTEQLASTSLNTAGYSTTGPSSYGDAPSPGYQSTLQNQGGDMTPRPIAMRSAAPLPNAYSYGTYSMSAPVGINLADYIAGTAPVPNGHYFGTAAPLYTNPQTLSKFPEPSAGPSNTAPRDGAGGSRDMGTLPNLIKGAANAKTGDQETLNGKFKVYPSKAFKMFQVFKVLWSQPMGETAKSSATDVTQFTIGRTKFGAKVHSSIRRFVVVTEDQGHCLCLAISTYQKQGTGKRGVKSDDHAIIFTKDRPPEYVSGESALTKDPIEVKPKTLRDTLEVGSRLNYAKVYTVEHNVKVHFVGQIHPNSQSRFYRDYDMTRESKRSYIGEEADD